MLCWLLGVLEHIATYFFIGLIITFIYSFDLYTKSFCWDLDHNNDFSFVPYKNKNIWMLSIIFWPVTFILLVLMYKEYFGNKGGD